MRQKQNMWRDNGGKFSKLVKDASPNKDLKNYINLKQDKYCGKPHIHT